MRKALTWILNTDVIPSQEPSLCQLQSGYGDSNWRPASERTTVVSVAGTPGLKRGIVTNTWSSPVPAHYTSWFSTNALTMAWFYKSDPGNKTNSVYGIWLGMNLPPLLSDDRNMPSFRSIVFKKKYDVGQCQNNYYLYDIIYWSLFLLQRDSVNPLFWSFM